MSKLKEMEGVQSDGLAVESPPPLNSIKNCWVYSCMKAKLMKSHSVTSLLRMIEAIKVMGMQDLPQAYFMTLCFHAFANQASDCQQGPHDQVLM